MGTPTGERRYGGKTAQQRRAERRERLLDTGLELFGTQGYANTSIEGLCGAAGLNARYFYEEFESREGLLLAVYDRHVQTVFAAVVAAVTQSPTAPRERLATGLTAFVSHTLADPRAARVNYFEMVGVSRALEGRRREVLAMYAEMIASEFAALLGPHAQAPGGDLHSAAVALVAATDGLIIDRLSAAEQGTLEPADPQQMVRSLTAIFATAFGV